jgi:hypothetical protein
LVKHFSDQKNVVQNLFGQIFKLKYWKKFHPNQQI